MIWSGAVVGLLLFAQVCIGAPLGPPDFEIGYYAKGVLHMPYAEIAEPFEAWYDPTNGRSRIDYYNDPLAAAAGAAASLSRTLRRSFLLSPTPCRQSASPTYLSPSEITASIASGPQFFPVPPKAFLGGGMVKTFQSSQKDADEYQMYPEDNSGVGTVRKIIPVTTEVDTNDIICWEQSERSVKPQSVFPNMTDFRRAGVGKVRGFLCEKWKLVSREGNKTNLYTMWMKIKEGAGGRLETRTPVRFEVKGKLTAIESAHFDQYYLDYESFEPGNPDLINFDTPEGMTCKSLPISEDRHGISFNPMQEFIHGYDAHVEDEFHQFRHAHNRSYSPPEHCKRKEMFRQNLRFITSKNRAGLGFSLAVNHLADRSADELSTMRGRKQTTSLRGEGSGSVITMDSEDNNVFSDTSDDEEIPESVDWRLRGAVTPVKDQAVCGSCWSFGVTGVVEGAYFVKYGKLISLSEQALVDCSWGFGNEGCDGGLEPEAYKWILEHGIPREADYGPYLAQDGYCHIDNVKPAVNLTGWGKVNSRDVTALKKALAKVGPISIGIDASSKTFAFYSNGVFSDDKCHNFMLNHAVLLVGYGELDGRPYWVVKNSWSTQWGNDGYILMAATDNDCGVTTEPSFVIL